MATAVAARNYARNLILDSSTRYADLDTAGIAALADARRQLASSVGAITAALAPGGEVAGPAAGRQCARKPTRPARSEARIRTSEASAPRSVQVLRVEVVMVVHPLFLHRRGAGRLRRGLPVKHVGSGEFVPVAVDA